MRAALLAVAFALAFANASAQEMPQYSMTLLPSLGGSDAGATAINAAGDVAGYSYLAGNQGSHAVIWARRATLDLGTLGGAHSTALAIDNLGRAVGIAHNTRGTLRPFVFENGQMHELTEIPPGPEAGAYGVNDAGVIVGSAWIQTAEGGTYYRGFISSPESVEFLGTLGDGLTSYAYAVNASGQVAGVSSLADMFQERAFFYSDGLMTDLGTLGGRRSAGRSINSHGHVCGESTLSGDIAMRVFVFRNGALHNMGFLGGNYAYCSAINDNGFFVGTADTTTGRQSGYVSDGVSMYNLNDLISPKTLDGWYIWVAQGINGKGQIAANACKEGAGCRAVRLDPVGKSKRAFR